jgi:uncharacterized protein YraI
MKRIPFLLALALLVAACGTATPAPAAPSATLTRLPSATPTPTFTSSPVPPTATATPLIIDGTLTVKVNVRSGPGTSYASLGQLNAGEKVQIISRDAVGSWYQVLYPAASDGSAWVTAQYVQIPAGTQVPLPPTPKPGGSSGRVLQRLNVRSGPGLSFDALGMLEPDALVTLTGRNPTASWFQIDYPSGPGGHAWVTAQYIQTEASGLPVLDDQGTPVPGDATGPTPLPIPPTPTAGPAFPDGDSAANPGVRVTFSGSCTRQFSYASQVSAPQGDPSDWIEFTPYAVNATEARLAFSLVCTGNGSLVVGLEQGGAPLLGGGGLACGDQDVSIALPAGQPYLLHLQSVPGTGLQLVDYILTVRNLP